MRNILPLLLCLFFACSSAWGQSLTPQLIGSGSGEGTVGSTTVNFSIGETAVTTLENSSHKLTQGLLQGSVIIVSTQSGPTVGNSFTLFPNPSEGVVTLSSDRLLSGAVLTLFNASGQRVEQFQLNTQSVEQPISLTGLAAGLYHVQIIENSQLLHHQKLIIR